MQQDRSSICPVACLAADVTVWIRELVDQRVLLPNDVFVKLQTEFDKPKELLYNCSQGEQPIQKLRHLFEETYHDKPFTARKDPTNGQAAS